MSFPRYAEYVDSGVEWLGEVPKDWELVRGDAYLRSPAKIVNADDLSGKEIFHYSIPIVQSTGDGQIEDGDEVFSSKLLVDQQQVLISKLNPRKNTVCIAKPHEIITVTSGEFVPLQSDKLDLRWVYYLVSSENFKQRLESLVESATRSHQRVNPSDILKFNGAFPISAEQTQIARFLDHETTKIDALIAEQKRLIKLLQEKRQAVISHAVTKGLDPNVPMKDSGVEWLGEVPAHWEVARMRFVCRITTGNRDTQDAEPEGTYPFFVRSDTIERSNGYCFDGEGVFTSGDGAGVGKIFHYYRGKCAIHQRVYLFHSFRLTTGKFFYHYLRSNLEPVVLSQSAKSTVDSLRLPMLQNFWMTIPPKNEQVDIDAFIEDLETKTCRLLTDCQSSIELLLERRSALISAAVTGKIDVRDWQPPADESAFDEDVRKAGMEASA